MLTKVLKHSLLNLMLQEFLSCLNNEALVPYIRSRKCWNSYAFHVSAMYQHIWIT